jgi:hypothetical protein
MEFNPLFVVPSQIRTVRLVGDFKSICIDNLWRTVRNIKTLEIPIDSKDMMVDTIDQFDYLDNFVFICDDLWEGDYLEFFIEKLRLHWLEDNSYRLRMNHFTF